MLVATSKDHGDADMLRVVDNIDGVDMADKDNGRLSGVVDTRNTWTHRQLLRLSVTWCNTDIRHKLEEDKTVTASPFGASDVVVVSLRQTIPRAS
jgi:predicted RNA-binding protein YlxR (DUF448 family)